MGQSCSTKSTCCTTDDVSGHDDKHIMPSLKTAIVDNFQLESDSDDDDLQDYQQNSSTKDVCHIS